jgi:hypothetical protein
MIAVTALLCPTWLINWLEDPPDIMGMVIVLVALGGGRPVDMLIRRFAFRVDK